MGKTKQKNRRCFQRKESPVCNRSLGLVHLYDMAVAWHVPKTTSPPGCHRDTWYYVTGLNDILRTSEMMSSSSHHWHITDTCSSPVEILQDTDTDDTPSFVMLDFWSEPSLNRVYFYKTRATLETLFYDALYKISCSTKIALSLCNEWMSISNTTTSAYRHIYA